MMTFVNNHFLIDIDEEVLDVSLSLGEDECYKLCSIDPYSATITTFDNSHIYLDLPMDHIGNVVWIAFESLFNLSQNDKSNFHSKLRLYFSHILRCLGRDQNCENFLEEIEDMVDFIHLTMVLSEEKSSIDLLRKYLSKAD